MRASDVTFWGVGALAAWGLAILALGAAAVLPGGLLAGLHTPLTQVGTMGQLQAEVASLETEAEALKAGNTMLMQRVALGEQSRNDLTKRLGALEVTVPQLVEATNARSASPVDNTIVTGSTTTPAPVVLPADGGTVSVTTTPLAGATAAPADTAAQQMPSALEPAQPDPNAFGVALGPPILVTEAPAAWKSMTDRAGTLLLGLTPLTAPIEGAPGRKLVAGPLQSESDATALCGGFARMGIACSAVPFVGSSLPN